MKNELSTIEQHDIAFYDDQIVAVRVNDGGVYIPLRPICELLGIAWQPQARKLNSDPILSEVSASVTIRLQVADSRGSINSSVLALPLDYLNGWLFGINANRVKPEVRERLLTYQRDSYRVLFEAFKSGELTTEGDDLSDVAAIDPDAVEALTIARAVVKLAQSHVRLIRQVSQAESKIESVAATLSENVTRLDALEAEMGNPDRLIAQSQQMEVKEAVKALAYELSQRSGHNEFQGVYGELYRRFEVASYKQLPASKHAEAMGFLSDWYSRITGSELPF